MIVSPQVCRFVCFAGIKYIYFAAEISYNYKIDCIEAKKFVFGKIFYPGGFH